MTGKKFILGLAAASLLSMGIRECRSAEWDNVDRVLFGSFVTLQAIDIAQTNRIHREYPKYQETNNLFGEDPNMALVIGAKVGVTGLIYWIVRDMPGVDRKLLLSAVNLVQFSVVHDNYQIGLKFGF